MLSFTGGGEEEEEEEEEGGGGEEEGEGGGVYNTADQAFRLGKPPGA